MTALHHKRRNAPFARPHTAHRGGTTRGGSPDECIEEIERYREALGITELLVRIQWPGMPQLQAMKNLEMVGKTLVEHYSK